MNETWFLKLHLKHGKREAQGNLIQSYVLSCIQKYTCLFSNAFTLKQNYDVCLLQLLWMGEKYEIATG